MELDLSRLSDAEKEVLLVPLETMTNVDKARFDAAIRKVPFRSRMKMARLSEKDLRRACKAGTRARQAARHPFAPAIHTLGKIGTALILAGGLRAIMGNASKDISDQSVNTR